MDDGRQTVQDANCWYYRPCIAPYLWVRKLAKLHEFSHGTSLVAPALEAPRSGWATSFVPAPRAGWGATGS